MQNTQAIKRVVDLTDDSKNIIYNMTVEEARELVAADDINRVRPIMSPKLLSLVARTRIQHTIDFSSLIGITWSRIKLKSAGSI